MFSNIICIYALFVNRFYIVFYNNFFVNFCMNRADSLDRGADGFYNYKCYITNVI